MPASPHPFDARLGRLLTHAARVFAQRGFHSTSMRDLAAASGMSLAGMYYYVKGKDDLLFLIQERCFSQVLAGAERVVAEAADPLERLHAFIHHHVTFFAAHLPETKVLAHEANALHGTPRRAVDAIKRRYVDLLVGLLRAAAPEQAGLERRATAYVLFGMMNWMYNWYDPAGALDPERLAGLITRIFLGGFVEARFPVTGG